MAIFLAAAGVFIAVALIFFLSGRLSSPFRKVATTAPAAGANARTCPLCGSALSLGERVKSDLTKGPGDRIMRIYGCPRCWPQGVGISKGSASLPPRICPYCKGEIPMDGFAIARYFERPGRKHVHVLGCTRCRPRS